VLIVSHLRAKRLPVGSRPLGELGSVSSLKGVLPVLVDLGMCPPADRHEVAVLVGPDLDPITSAVLVGDVMGDDIALASVLTCPRPEYTPLPEDELLERRVEATVLALALVAGAA
jgi:hypothetical protein